MLTPVSPSRCFCPSALVAVVILVAMVIGGYAKLRELTGSVQTMAIETTAMANLTTLMEAQVSPNELPQSGRGGRLSVLTSAVAPSFTPDPLSFSLSLLALLRWMTLV